MWGIASLRGCKREKRSVEPKRAQPDLRTGLGGGTAGSSVMAHPQELVTLLDPEGGSFPLGDKKLLYNPLSKALYMG